MDIEKIINELEFQFSRSSGAGGQHVNKVSTRVTLNFNIEDTQNLSDEEKEMVHNKLKNSISKKGILSLSSDATRSQHKNKELVIKRFSTLLQKAITPTKKRKPTKRPKSIDLIRLEKKKRLSEKKTNRKKIN